MCQTEISENVAYQSFDARRQLRTTLTHDSTSRNRKSCCTIIPRISEGSRSIIFLRKNCVKKVSNFPGNFNKPERQVLT